MLRAYFVGVSEIDAHVILPILLLNYHDVGELVGVLHLDHGSNIDMLLDFLVDDQVMFLGELLPFLFNRRMVGRNLELMGDDRWVDACHTLVGPNETIHVFG